MSEVVGIEEIIKEDATDVNVDATDSTNDATNNNVAQDVVEDDASDDANDKNDANDDANDSTEWFLREGVKGEGEKPDWFKDSKYKTVEDQAKAYVDLEKKYGAFTGAPKDGYDLHQLDDQIKEMGLEIDEEDPLLAEYIEFAKDSQMNQEKFNEGLKLYMMGKQADILAMEETRKAEIESLGDNAENILSDMRDWAKASLPEENQKGFLEAFPTAEAIRAGMEMIKMAQPENITPSNVTSATTMTVQEVEAMQFELDDNGERRINTDPAFKEKYEEASRKVRGTQRYIEMVGK